MDTNKLLKAIQILVEAEVKKQLPKIVAEVVNSKQTNTIIERVKEKSVNEVKQKSSMAKAILGKDYQKPKNDLNESVVTNTVQYTKNPVLNQILNETRVNTSNVGELNDGYEEWPTMNNPMANMNPTSNVESMRASMASKMGYGDMNTGGGLGVKTGNDALDKALNRNYSELVKRF